MKKLFLITMLVLFSFAGQIQDIAKSLRPWEPLNIKIKYGELVITSKERRMNLDIFYAMIRNGICVDYYFNKNLLNGIRKIVILNRFNHQGFVLEGGKDVCKTIGKMSNDTKIKIFLSSKTHLY